MFSFSGDVGNGSRSQDLDGDCLIILSISTSDKLENESNEQFVLNASIVNGFELCFWESRDALILEILDWK